MGVCDDHQLGRTIRIDRPCPIVQLMDNILKVMMHGRSIRDLHVQGIRSSKDLGRSLFVDLARVVDEIAHRPHGIRPVSYTHLGVYKRQGAGAP